jgi:hypothetical protein
LRRAGYSVHKYLASPRDRDRPRPDEPALSLSPSLFIPDGISASRGRHRAVAGGRSLRGSASERRFLHARAKPYRSCYSGDRGHGSGEEDAPRGALWFTGRDV